MAKIRKVVFLGVLLCLYGCGGQSCGKGDLGPKGDTGADGSVPNTNPIYYYNASFDTAADVVGNSPSGWAEGSGGGGVPVASISNVDFNSPGQSMNIVTPVSVAFGTRLFRPLTINTNLDTWVEFDWKMTGVGLRDELVLNTNGSNRLVVGFEKSTTQVYLLNGATRVNVLTGPADTWHHIKMVLWAGGTTSSYWFDGMSIGTNYTTNDGVTIPETTCFIGIWYPGGATTGSHYIDNLKVYHF